MSAGGSLVLLLAFVLLRVVSCAVSSDCKSYDERSRNAGKSSPSVATPDRKVVCSNMELHQVLPAQSFPNRTVTLILSNNKIQELLNGSFAGLSTLERLDIKNNFITRIEPGAFLSLTALKRLDLSNNRIGCLNVDIFKGLTNLVKLNLSGNMFSSLAQGTFDSLVSLKTLEFQSPFLLCDCNLQWLVRWTKERSVAVKDTRCSYPRSLQGQLLTALKPDMLTCDAPLELPSFQMTPSQHQIVFQGDSLPFQCMASFVDEDMQVLWYQDGKMVEPDATQGIYIEKSMVQNCSLIASALTISNIQPGFTGDWECRVRTSRGNNTRTVHIVVLESTAKYCTPERVSNNKGEYKWPRTLAGITAYLPCARQVTAQGSTRVARAEDRRARRRCNRSGRWAEEDYTRCEYMKDTTRVLHIINQMALNLTNAVHTAQQLLVYTVEAPKFSDKVDVIFVAEMIEKIGTFAEKYKELGDVMVDISSNLMLTDERVLWMAQKEARACSRIVDSLQRIAAPRLATGSYYTNSHNIALEAHVIKASSFNGMTCTLYQKVAPERPMIPHLGPLNPDVNLGRQLSFKCNVTSNLSALALKNTIVEASVQFPAALFPSLAEPGTADDTAYKLQLLAFRNGKLFPPTGNSSVLAEGSKRRSVVTPVILAKIEGVPPKPLLSSINVTLRRFLQGSNPVAGRWDVTALDGQGGWQSDGCVVLHHDDNFTTLSCDSLSNYALLMDLSRTEMIEYNFKPLHAIIYATAIVLMLCLLAVIVSYVYHHRSVRISKKCWHMLVNLCLHVLLTCAAYAGGINQTRYTSVCQAVGIVLHYSTLATALWSGVTARNIYKQVTRKTKIYEELEEPPPPPRPMLRFYLIGGGIPIIVCGITAAANVKNYGSRSGAPYCWMAWEPSLGAFYGPVVFIIFVDCMYFLRVLLQLHRHPERRFELKEQAEEQQRLSAAETAEVGPGHAESSPAVGEPPVLLSALENEHTFAAQLSGVAGTLALCTLLWVFGALAVSQEHPADLVFACLFGAAALALGAFLVGHHCVTRQDMRQHWTQACCLGRRSYAPQVDALLGPGAAAAETPPTGNVEGGRCPASGTESSCTNKSAPSLLNSAQGCKITNLQVEAAQCKGVPAPANGAVLLDNSLTEHSLDTEIKMHVSPIEVQYRPVSTNGLPGMGSASVNGHPVRHHKNRARAHRASRLTVLREYAYDVPTSVEGSVQSAPHRRHHHHDSVHARNSRRAAYLAYRERQQSQLQQDSSDAGTSLPRRPRLQDRTACKALGNSLTASLGNGLAGSLANGLGNGQSNGVSNGGAAGEDAETHTPSPVNGCPKQSLTVELEVQPKSYGLNLASDSGTAKSLERPQNGQPINMDSSGIVKTGLWKHETTV
ncbi:LOW QUALITY PROTEIN: adhesion G protein-coupled receptor A3 [Electrophorus electricus]|uniref:LOW QUALITY PROTEIN: adhesion G protein-coupled receptor A3 n=1 Tax=Electrophorus electricus TaxID=8005 RepID=UPI0015CF8DAF|nr:LOW QUALITY PROTEIN: adhesion G protein-coupled receptor A3 [Electrophorus electricus]